MTDNIITKIAVTGPESTGKSWLAEKLSRHFNTVWVPEYARLYLTEKNGVYRYEDILEIAKGQKREEQLLLNKANRYLFTDTEPIVTKIWSEVVFGKCDPWIIQEIQTNPYDLYLLCYPDLPWEPDPLRENPDDRERLFDYYVEELEKYNLPFEVIKGQGEQRFMKALSAIQKRGL
jgi:NadR type nicotinamide-nucleotide adenylyltransferase